MALSPVDYSQLIPELPRWNNGAGIAVDSWIGCVGNFELAVGYSVLFWPDFTEFDGCVFFADFSEQSYRGFMQQCAGDRQSVEAVMNHRHVFDYFSHANGNASVEQLLYLGRLLKSILHTKLAADFPQRRFEVSFLEGPFEDLHDYEISFWQSPDVDPGGP
jgi:hypothetical protein